MYLIDSMAMEMPSLAQLGGWSLPACDGGEDWQWRVEQRDESSMGIRHAAGRKDAAAVSECTINRKIE